MLFAISHLIVEVTLMMLPQNAMPSFTGGSWPGRVSLQTIQGTKAIRFRGQRRVQREFWQRGQRADVS